MSDEANNISEALLFECEAQNWWIRLLPRMLNHSDFSLKQQINKHALISEVTSRPTEKSS